MRKWLRRIASSLMDRIAGLEPFQVAVAACVWALTLLLLSAVVGVFSYQYAGKEVGYALTLNWSIGFTIMAPFFYFSLLLAYREVGDLASRLDAAGMLRRIPSEVQSNGASVFAARWTKIRRDYAVWWLAGSLLGFAESMWEWWVYSGSPLLTDATPRENEIDWSVRFINDGWNAYANAGFSLLVFFQQVLLISMVTFLLYLAVSFVKLIRESRKQTVSARLFPSVTYEPDDRRRGFQVFSNFLSYFLLAGVFLYAHFLLSRLWNVYLRLPPAEAQSIWVFLRDTILDGIRVAGDLGGMRQGITELIRDLGALDFSGLFVALGAILVFLICLALLVVVLRQAAKSGRRELLGSGVRGQAEVRLRNMVFWPMHYPKLTTLLSIGFLAILGMIAYKVALLLIGIAIGLALTAALKNLFFSGG